MFNNPDFYPTPIWLIKKMLEPYKASVHVGGINGRLDPKGYGKLENFTILEPSAGKGDILDFLTGEYIIKSKEAQEKETGQRAWCDETSVKSVNNKQIYCIERDAELRHILSQKNYRVIDTDFLSFVPDNHFDLIIMNPPFSNGDEHLLKAWQILIDGDIVCLLNAETLKNPYTERRKLLLKIIEDNKGSIEYLQDQFLDAERKTGVEVALVRLSKAEKDSRFNFEFKNVTNETKFNLNEDNIKNLPETLDIVGNMITQFDKLKEVFVDFLKVQEALNFYGEPLTGFQNNVDYNGMVDLANKLRGSKQERYNQFTDIVRSEMWQFVISRLGMERVMTKKVKENFTKFRKTQAQMQFTKENIADIINMLINNSTLILEEAIPDVFDALTANHEYNRCHVEGWKTNSAWKVNKKIIFPYGCDFDQTWYNQGYGTKFKVHNYYSDSSYNDIDKVLAYISGKNFDEEVRTIQEALHRKFEIIGYIEKGHSKLDNTCQSTFFDIKFWKKGTLHITFRDESLWNEFNMRACYGKKWLPWNEEKAWKESKEPPKEEVAPVIMIEAPKEDEFEPFRKIVMESDTCHEAFLKIRYIKNVSLETSTKFYNKYNPDGVLDPSQSFKIFYNEIKNDTIVDVSLIEEEEFMC